MSEIKVLNIAHRGLEMEAPENTIAAFKMALSEGADGFELDVQLSKDGKVIVMHDLSVDRTTNGSGIVKDKTVQELRQLDAGSWFCPEFRGEKIPTLEEVFEKLPQDTIIDIELKGANISPALSREVVKIIHKYNASDRAFVASYNPLALWYVRRYSKTIRRKIIGLFEGIDPAKSLINRFLLLLHRKSKKLLIWFVRPEIIDTHHENLTQQLVTRLKQKSFVVMASILENRTDMQKVINFGVDIIINRNPQLLKEVLRKSR